MDSVKSLMRGGFIQKIEDDQWEWETGPNVILLSDVSIQNGAFCNLSEFPTMHMLFKQGLGIPNHPGNTGMRPLMIGIPEQIEGQQEYAARGVGGLTTQEVKNLKSLSEDDKRELLEIKAKFKYGGDEDGRDTVDFLEILVNEQPYTIKDELKIVRLGLNVYLFQYKDQEEIVDLTLTENQTYGVPYNLDFHPVTARDFSVIHSGEGNGWDKDRPCMGSIVCCEGKYYLIDAGPNILESLSKLGIGLSEVEGVFITHSHDDHFAGLTGLFGAENKMKFYCSEPVRISIIRKLISLLKFDEPLFNTFFEVHDLRPDKWNKVGGMEVMPIMSPHPIETNIYYFRMPVASGGYRSYAHLADVVSSRVYKSFLEGPGNEFLRSRYARTWRAYLRAVNVKKIDCNGGLIHGDAEDYVDDKSARVLFSHTNGELNERQRELGSNATFGSEEILINATRDYPALCAYSYLSDYFPKSGKAAKLALLSGRRPFLSPGSVLIRKGEAISFVYLVLTGICEYIDLETSSSTRMGAGAILGEIDALKDEPSSGTYRTVSVVKAYKIPVDTYRQFVANSFIVADYIKLFMERRLLLQNPLFTSMSDRRILNKLTAAAEERWYKEGDLILDGQEDYISLVMEGLAGIFYQDMLVETLSNGSFYGQEIIFNSTPRVPSISALADMRVLRIKASYLLDTPVLLWRLLESADKIGKLVSQTARLMIAEESTPLVLPD